MSFIDGGVVFVIGLLALIEKNIEGGVFLMALGLVFMAASLGKHEQSVLFNVFLDLFRRAF